MDLLIIDTSSRMLTLAGEAGGRAFGLCLPDCGRAHSELLNRKMRELLEKEGLSLADFDLFGAVCGPGSFTGIRIGVTAARALCQVFEKPALPLNGLEVLCEGEGPLCGALDAGTGRLYVGAFDRGRELCPVQVIRREELPAFLAAHPHPLISPEPGLGQPPSDPAAVLLRAAKRKLPGGAVPFRELVPLYVRPCQAEENAKQTGRGGI